MIFLQNIPLKKYSNYKIGGPADYFYEFKSKEELVKALDEWKKLDPENKNILILGKATNILFNDAGFRGLVLKDEINFIEKEGEIIEAGSGVLISDLLDYCVKNSLSGLEWAGGLPGTVGGAVRGNAGAFGGETKDNVIEVESIDLETRQIKKRNNSKCLFGYRQSVFKNKDGGRRPGGPSPNREVLRTGGLAQKEVILSAKFKLKKGEEREIKQKTQEKIDYRISKHPLDLPNIGSMFKNIPVKQVPENVLIRFRDKIKKDPFPVLPVAKLLAEAGLKGRTVGGAMISPKHPNFIVNFNNAKAEDVKDLIEIVKKEIKEKFEVSLEEEIMIV